MPEMEDKEEDLKYIGMMQKFIITDEGTSLPEVSGGKTLKRKMTWLWVINKGGGKFEEWELKVADENKALGTISIIFSKDGHQEFNDKFKADFQYKKAFYGTLPDMHVTGVYEVRSMDGHDEWLAAVITKIRNDGRYGCKVHVPIDDPEDEYFGHTEEKEYPVVDLSFIRNAGDQKPAQPPGAKCQLDVKKSDPFSPMLLVNGKDWHDKGFCIPLPRPGKQIKDIELKVDKHYEEVEAKVSVGMLRHLADNDVHRVSEEAQKMNKHSWTMDMGPAGTHTISLEFHSTGMEKKINSFTDSMGFNTRASALGAGYKAEDKEFTLKVDDETIINCSPSDFDKSHFHCDIAFTYSVKYVFEVHELHLGGKATDTTAHKDVEKDLECRISIVVPDHEDLKKAELTVNKKDFAKLPKFHPDKDQQVTKIPLHMLEHECGLHVPRAGTQSEGFLHELQASWEEFKDWFPHDKKSFHHFMVDIGMMCGCKSGNQHSREAEVVEDGPHTRDRGTHWKEPEEVRTGQLGNFSPTDPNTLSATE